MRRFRFDSSQGHRIAQFDSDAVMSPITAHHSGAVKVGCFHIPPGGGLGRHEATVAQLFAVVRGDGWVTGGDDVRHAIATDEAVMWEAGEWHESGSDTGMTAIVIEGDVIPFGAALAHAETNTVTEPGTN